jgi:putative MFS transporter
LKQEVAMQQPRNFDDIQFSSIHRRIMLWGSGGPFLDGYVLVMIGVALEQLTPALKLDAQWLGLLGAGTLAGLFVGTSLFGYISDKVGRRKMFLIDIIAIGVISVATMFVSSPMELLVMRVLIGVVIGADYPIATSMITEFSSTRQRAFQSALLLRCGMSARPVPIWSDIGCTMWKADGAGCWGVRRFLVS